MLPEFGQFAIILALCLAVIQAIIPLIGAARGNLNYMRLSRYTAIGQFFFIAIAFFILAYSFVINDFSIAYVAANSNTYLPAIYRFCAIWGAHEGSLLLWILVLSIWTAAVSIFSRSLPLAMLARVLAVMAMISIGFYLFLLMTSDPFARLLPNIPINGRDLNPILQDPGLIIHPPMLYVGYVGFSVVFSFAMAALIEGRLDSTWAKWARPWTIVAWCFLTFGIVLGSWWSYRELGWGGWWFWDPVENASFLPWLVGTALLHSLSVTEKRHVFKAWTVLLAVCVFSLSLLGTFLVRSGVLISVHTFAVDPERGLFMLRFLLIVVGASLGLYAWRGHKIVNTGCFNVISRETMLLANNIILFVAMLTILLGTLYPLIIQALGLGKISVGAPYFNAVFSPLMIPMLLLMGIAPLFHWEQASLKPYIKRLLWVLLISIILAAVLPYVEAATLKISVFIGLALAFWVIVHTIFQCFHFNGIRKITLRKMSRSQWSMVLAHIGVGVAVIGIVVNVAYSEQRNLSIKMGGKVNLAGYQFTLAAMSGIKGSNYMGYQADIILSQKRKVLANLHPQVREYPIQQTTVAKTAINETVFRDLYVALGRYLGGNAWSLRIYYKPFVRWIWLGGLLIVLGGILALFDKRYRINEVKDKCL